MKSVKVSSSDEARHGRWYDDACGMAFAMELVGERWTLLIVRELMLGPLRFSDEGSIGFAADAALPLLRVFYGNQPLEQAEQASVELRGDRDLLRRFVALFALPPKNG